MTRVAIIVLNWNGASDTIDCLNSLASQTLQGDIILVDNHSSDNSVERLEKYCQKNKQLTIHFIKNTQNLGFAGGINSGIRLALKHKYKYTGILNPDAVADKNWLSSLASELDQHDDTAIVAGLLLRRDGKTIDSAGDWYSKWGLAFPYLRDKPVTDAPKEALYVFGATGGSVLYRTSLFESIGLFDESFFMYYEDVDLSFRAQLAGFKARYTPHAIAYHKQGASTNKVPGLAVYQTFKNLPLIMVKDVPGFFFPTLYPRLVLAYTLIFGRAIARGQGWPALKGWVMSYILTPRAFVARLHIQRNRRASNDYIRSIIWDDLPPEQTGLRKFRKRFNGES